MSPNINNQNNINFIEVTNYAENIFNIIDGINQNQNNLVLSFINFDILNNEANSLQRIKTWINCYLPIINNESKFDRFNLIHNQLQRLIDVIAGLMDNINLTEQELIVAENLVDKIDQAQEVLLDILMEGVQEFHFHLKLAEAVSCLE